MADTIFYAPEVEHTLQLPENESHHCNKVLRMKEGEPLLITDGSGFLYECILTHSHAKHCMVGIEKKTAQPKSWSFKFHIAFAPTKSMDRTEWFIEKATEMGTDVFTPLLCHHSERKEIKGERLTKTAIAAMKQSQQAFMPIIEDMTAFDKFIEQPFDGQKMIAHCHSSLKEEFTKVYSAGENVLILIGPEGDFSEEEVKKAEAAGFLSVSLGNNRLRTETACMVACVAAHVCNFG